MVYETLCADCFHASWAEYVREFPCEGNAFGWGEEDDGEQLFR